MQHYHDSASSTGSLVPPTFPALTEENSSGLNQHFDSARNSGVATPLNPSTTLLATAQDPALAGPASAEKQMYNSDGYVPSKYVSSRQQQTRRRRLLWCVLGTLIVIIIVFLAVFLPIFFKVIKPHQNKSTSSATSHGSAPATPVPSDASAAPTPTNPVTTSVPISGGDGSTVTLSSGQTITYTNNFGGTWYLDPNNPFVSNAQAQDDIPPLNTSWNWGVDPIRGVNLGGWFVLEPFIVPALFQKYPSASDEWTLSEAMRADTSQGGGISQLETHYQTFITEADFAQMAGAGLNFIRLPVPFWAIDVWPGEPFLEGVCWKYILQAFQWARKYGIRINLDLHTAPGSQNGYNHSGKGGQINFLNGGMGIANAQRMMGYIRVFTEFIVEGEWTDVVVMWSILNEPLMKTIGKEQMYDFYIEAHSMIRNITGFGAGNGPWLAFHDGFTGTAAWAGAFPGADRIALDSHPYFAFDGQANNEPLAEQPAKACNAWANEFNTSQTAYGLTIAGEFSNGINDCGLFLLGVTNPTPHYQAAGGNCDDWTIWENWNATVKEGLMEYALASMDALDNIWFFWTWKIGNDSVSGSVRAPLWDYQLGLENGWMPLDPRKSVGKCAEVGVPDSAPFDGTYPAWQTGGAGAGTISASFLASYDNYPPTTINNVPGGIAAASLPTYTSTGVVNTLPPPTLTATVSGSVVTVSAGVGWADAKDTGLAATPISGCTYNNPWDALTVAVSTSCFTAAARITARAEMI